LALGTWGIAAYQSPGMCLHPHPTGDAPHEWARYSGHNVWDGVKIPPIHTETRTVKVPRDAGQGPTVCLHTRGRDRGRESGSELSSSPLGLGSTGKGSSTLYKCTIRQSAIKINQPSQNAFGRPAHPLVPGAAEFERLDCSQLSPSNKTEAMRHAHVRR